MIEKLPVGASGAVTRKPGMAGNRRRELAWEGPKPSLDLEVHMTLLSPEVSPSLGEDGGLGVALDDERLAAAMAILTADGRVRDDSSVALTSDASRSRRSRPPRPIGPSIDS